MEQKVTDEGIRRIFAGAADFKARQLRCGEFMVFSYMIDGLVSGGSASEYIFRPLAQFIKGGSMSELYNEALLGTIYNSVAIPCTDLEHTAHMLVNGFCVVLFPGVGAIAFEVKTGDKRSPAPPALENTVKGPKDAFVETVRTNTSLVRRHLRTPMLRLWEGKVGKRSITNVTVLWIEDITSPELVEKMRRRIERIDIDAMISPATVEEYITGSRTTAFPLLQYTERADTFCRGLLDGRVGILVDGLPLGYLAPVDLGYLMQSPEDRSRDYISATCVKLLRWGALILDLLLPAVYVAAAAHHPYLLNETVRTVIQSGAEKAAFSPGVETLGMLIAFELLQESGIHLPQSIGQSVSTIGGIVVGTAAVEAGLLSPVALIAISIAGVCGFVLPNRDLANALRVWRFIFAAASCLAGGWGIAVAVAVLGVHLTMLKSLGIPYILVRKNEIFRPRLINQKLRNKVLEPKDKKNQK